VIARSSESPVAGSVGSFIGSTIRFTLISNGAFTPNSLRITINGVQIYNGTDFSAGWTTSTISTTGVVRIDVAATPDIAAYYPYSSSVLVGVQVADGGGSFTDSWSFVTSTATQRASIRVQNVTLNSTRVLFSTPISMNQEALTTANYFILSLDNGSVVPVVEVTGVRGAAASNFVDLKTHALIEGSNYRLEISNITNSSGSAMQSAIGPLIGEFTGVRTKIDTITATMPSIYGAAVFGTNLFGLLASVAMSDSLIGGQGAITTALVPLVDPNAVVAETYGSSTFKTGTYTPCPIYNEFGSAGLGSTTFDDP
jgi:hypothetical protein